MDNPCKHCTLADSTRVRSNKHGCNNPCDNAIQFRDKMSKFFDEVLRKLDHSAESLGKEGTNG